VAVLLMLAAGMPSAHAGRAVRLVKDVWSGPNGSSVTALTEMGGALYFIADDGVHGLELWRSSGTRARTRLVKDIWPGSVGSVEPDLWFRNCELVAAGDRLFLTASSPTRAGLWASDGTRAGTTLVKRIDPECLTALGRDAFFVASDPRHGTELWTSDGTRVGTRRVMDIARGTRSSYPEELTPVGDALFFTARDRHGRELWITDATGSGTSMVRDIDDRRGSSPHSLSPVRDAVFFSADDGIHGREPWRSDGTRRGTRLVRDIDPGSDDSYPSGAIDAAGTAFFWASRSTRAGDSIVRRESLWTSDGSRAGTAKVSPVDLGPWDPDEYWYYPGTVAAVGERIYFTSEDSTHGLELWTSDGTRDGTRIVRDIAPGRKDSVPYWLTEIDGELHFFAFLRGPNGRAPLWKTDGTPAGTVIVQDDFPAPPSEQTSPGWLTLVGETRFLTAARPATGLELWALRTPS
jgi:ELWxxDGT repeat protein